MQLKRSLIFALLVLFAVMAPLASGQNGKKALTHDDYDRWRSVSGTSLSDDGSWLMYTLRPREGDSELHVKSVTGEAEHVIANGQSARFTKDNKFVVMQLQPLEAEVKQAKKDKVKSDRRPKTALGILDLATGEVTRVERIKSFRMAADSSEYVAYLLEKPPAPPKKEGKDGDKEGADEASGIAGSWEGTLAGEGLPGGEVEMNIEISVSAEGEYSGEVGSPMGTLPLEAISFDPETGAFEAKVELPEGSSGAITGEVSGETMSGNVAAGPMEFEFSLKRTKKPESESAPNGKEAAAEPAQAEPAAASAPAEPRGERGARRSGGGQRRRPEGAQRPGGGGMEEGPDQQPGRFGNRRRGQIPPEIAARFGLQSGQEGDEEGDDDKKKKKTAGTELVVRHLATGEEQHFDHVTSYTFTENGARMAFVVSTEDGEGDGVFIVAPGAADAEPVMTGKGNYRSLSFDEAGEQLAFLTNRDDYDSKQSEYVICHWRAGMEKARILAANGRKGIPSDMWVSQGRGPSFSKSGKRITFSITEKPEPEPEEEEKKEDEEDEDKEPEVKVDVWHWRDPYLQPQQLRQVSRERNKSFLAVAHLGDGLEEAKIVKLGAEDLTSVSIGGQNDGPVALATSNLPYRQRVSWDSNGFSDVYLIDVKTGERTELFIEKRGSFSLSPGCRFVTWYDPEERNWNALEIATGNIVNLSLGIPHPVHNELHDQPSLARSHGTAGWLPEDEAILINDRYDIWACDPTGTWAPRCITEGAGRREGLRFRLTRLDFEEPTLDPTEPLLLTAFHYLTKDAGFYRDRYRGRSEPKQLVLAPYRFGSPDKAEEANVIAITRQSFTDYPDVWVTDLDFRKMKRMTGANPQQSEYSWGTAELFEWCSGYGEDLQGILYKPDNYEEGKAYPAMVYFYERSSDGLHSYKTPAPGGSSINISFYVSRGYVCFVPDIPYKIGYPGDSAMNAVVPGVMKLMEAGIIDEKRIGVQGHSWGGYQIAYMITQTDIFTCAESGAPVSNMTSAYGGIRWSSGMSRMFQYEKTQSRIGGTLWDSQQKYIENSPVFWADRVNTPVLMLHNDEDGAVPWYQGIEYFVALRRLNKPVWMLNYNGEAHGLRKYENRKDWTIRMQQFFDHYLMDAPAPVWLAHGVPAVQKGKTLGLDLVEDDDPGHHIRDRK